MTFRITRYSKIEITQVVDVRTTAKNKYNRARIEGPNRAFWQIDMTTPPLPYAEAMGVAAYLDSLKGSLEIIEVPNPLPELATRTGLTTLAIDAKESKTLRIDGFISHQSNAVVAGDFVQHSTSQKVHRIVNTANANDSNNVSATITPELYANTEAGGLLKYGDAVIFQCCLDEYYSMNVSASNGKFVVFNITLMEQG
jgi:hypothetical protein